MKGQRAVERSDRVDSVEMVEDEDPGAGRLARQASDDDVTESGAARQADDGRADRIAWRWRRGPSSR